MKVPDRESLIPTILYRDLKSGGIRGGQGF